MFDRRNEIKKLKKEFRENYVLIHKEDENSFNNKQGIKSYSPRDIYKVIGTRKLLPSGEFTKISSRAGVLLDKLLNEEGQREKEKKTSPNNIRIIDIHKQTALVNFYKAYTVFLILPAGFIFKMSKMNSMTVFRFIFLLPILFAIPSINDAIKLYTTRREAINMLYCIEKYYKNKPEVYDRYKEFMEKNSLEFREIKKEKDKEVDKKINSENKLL
jgi:hypothetical protein